MLCDQLICKTFPWTPSHLYSSIAHVEGKPWLANERDMTPVTQLPVAIHVSSASSGLAMSRCWGQTSAWAVCSEPGCKEFTSNCLDAATPSDDAHSDGPHHRGRQKAVGSAHVDNDTILSWGGDHGSSTASHLATKWWHPARGPHRANRRQALLILEVDDEPCTSVEIMIMEWQLKVNMTLGATS